MNKAQLIGAIAQEAGITKVEAKKSFDAFVKALVTALKEEGRISLPHLGTFVVVHKKERVGRDPRNGNPIRIPAKNSVKFRPGPEFTENTR